ncbi:hypothetical protein MA16_Dca003878 [Dendrobium catenatum]|uniref:Uncharacterized protein n=1 Tax=Dendrobium catenatum TaxID=906689 RepID=A0A2I0X1S7_9ASPA|nr:hypothetical protein MA16_Dca003878 [Dendrobium catenatum]
MEDELRGSELEDTAFHGDADHTLQPKHLRLLRAIAGRNGEPIFADNPRRSAGEKRLPWEPRAVYERLRHRYEKKPLGVSDFLLHGTIRRGPGAGD